MFSTASTSLSAQYQVEMSPVNINGVKIGFEENVEHVGILRSCVGNLPNLLNRIKSHKRALGAALHVGMARNHRGNPAYSLRVHQLY